MYCPNCGNKVPDAAKLCENCGELIITDESDLPISDSEVIKLIPAKCTNCGGNLTVDPAKKKAVCPYCNTSFIVNEAIHNYNIDTVEGNINVENATINVNHKNLEEEYYSCPKCHSTNIQKLSVAYQEGHTEIEIHSKDDSWTNSKEYKTTGVQKTKLAESAAPPQNQSYWEAIFALVGLYVIVSIIKWVVLNFLIPTGLKSLAETIGSWGIDLLFIYLLYSWLIKVHEYKKIYPQKLDEWKRSWICKKCGHIFVKDYLE